MVTHPKAFTDLMTIPIQESSKSFEQTLTPEMIRFEKHRQERDAARKALRRDKFAKANEAWLSATGKDIVAKRNSEATVIKGMLSLDEQAALKNRKRIQRKQKYSLTKATVSGDTNDLFARSSKMARTQKLSSSGNNPVMGVVKPSGTMELGGKLIPIRLATKR